VHSTRRPRPACWSRSTRRWPSSRRPAGTPRRGSPVSWHYRIAR
jgi:hypothetical protein